MSHLKLFFIRSLILCLLIIQSLPLLGQGFGGPYTPDLNTLLLMHFDGTTTEASSDLTVTDHGTTKSFPASHKTELGNAVAFDNSVSGNNSFLTVAHDQLLSLTGDWTIEFWLRIDSWDLPHNNWPVPIVLPTTGWNSNYFLEIPASLAALKYGFYHSGGSTVLFSSNGSISPGQWVHIALINDFQNAALRLMIHDTGFMLIEDQTLSYSPGTQIETGAADLRIGGGIAGDNYLNGVMDELRISNVVREFSTGSSDLPPLQFETMNLEFYAAETQVDEMASITEALQTEFSALKSIWSRPGIDPFIPENEKIKFYLISGRADLLTQANTALPDWKCSWYDHQNLSVFVCLPETQEQSDFYDSFESLSKGALAQLMLRKRLLIQGNNTTRFDFFEGFGLYRGGYRPERDQILAAQTDLSRIPSVNDIANKTNLSEGYMKDLAVAYIEAEILSRWATFNLAPYMGDDYFQPYLQHYFLNQPNDIIAPRGATENFTIFSTPADTQWIEAVGTCLETRLAEYSSDYELELPHRFSVVIFPDEAAGMALMNFDDGYFGGGGWAGDKLDILSPSVFVGGIEEATYSLIPHEFFHIFHHHFAYDGIPSGFWPEGMAELMAYGEDSQSYLEGKSWYIGWAMDNFQTAYGRPPVLADFIADADGTLSVYTFGQAFFYLLHENYADYVTIRHFFEQNLNWDVFDASYEELEAGFLNYLNILAGVTPVKNDVETPEAVVLFENFPNPFNPETHLQFILPQAAKVSVRVHDVRGVIVSELLNQEMPQGQHDLMFSGEGLSAGVYFYTLTTPETRLTQKMLLLK